MLVTGILGELTPNATIHAQISAAHRIFKDGAWHTVPENTTWYFQGEAYMSHKAALNAALEQGYKVVSEKLDDHQNFITTLCHTATYKALMDQQKQLAQKWANAKPCYVRFGKLPPEGRSRNHADGSWEKGVSVFRGQRLPSGEARPLPSTNQELGTLLSLQSHHRDLYIVTGEEIGTGSDGEPLLRNARIWRKAK